MQLMWLHQHGYWYIYPIASAPFLQAWRYTIPAHEQIIIQI